MAPDIEIIQDCVAGIVSAAPQLGPHAAGTLSAVRASWSRAGLPEKRLSSAARHSIASSAMSFAASAYAALADDPESMRIVGRLMKHAAGIDGEPSGRHTRKRGYAPAGEWQGPDGGPWTRVERNSWSLVLFHTPGMPGGDWTVAVGNAPCLYGQDPEEVDARTVAMLESVDSALRAGAIRRRVQAWPRPGAGTA